MEQKNASNKPANTFLQNEQQIRVLPPKNTTDVKQVASFIAGLMRLGRSMYKKEIADWQNARQMALSVEKPRRYYLYEVYRDVEIDMFFKGQVSQRINRIKNRHFRIVTKDGTVDKEKTKLLKKRWFKRFLRYSMESKFWGFNLTYFMIDEKTGKFECKKVCPEHVSPDESLILRSPYDMDGLRYDEGDPARYCIPIGEVEDLGLYESLALGYILKKHSWQSWDELEEKYGIPLMIAKTASEDREVQNEIVSWMEELGAASHGLFPMDTEIDVKDNISTDIYEIFNQKRKAINEEAAILINGQQESSNNTGSRAKTEALIQSTTDQITLDDKGDMEDIINDDLLPLLINTFKFPFSPDDRFEWDDADSLSLPDMADVFTKVDQMGFELDPKDVSEKLGVKILGKKIPATTTADPNKPPKDNPKPDPKTKRE